MLADAWLRNHRPKLADFVRLPDDGSGEFAAALAFAKDHHPNMLTATAFQRSMLAYGELVASVIVVNTQEDLPVDESPFAAFLHERFGNGFVGRAERFLAKMEVANPRLDTREDFDSYMREWGKRLEVRRRGICAEHPTDKPGRKLTNARVCVRLAGLGRLHRAAETRRASTGAHADEAAPAIRRRSGFAGSASRR